MARSMCVMVARAREQLVKMQRSMEAHNAQVLDEIVVQRTAMEEEVAAQRTAMKAEVAAERAALEQEVAAGRAALEEEIAAMQQVERAQDSRVALNVGGVRYETSIATLRSTPGTMLDAMFSGRHAMDPDDSDGAHFLDRDGAHFKYVLEYLRDGVSVLEEAAGDVRLLRALKREFGYFAIEVEQQPQQQSSQAVYAVGGLDGSNTRLSSMSKFDPATDTWTELEPMSVAKSSVGSCAVEGKLYVTGGWAGYVTVRILATVDRYDPATDTWDSAVAPMPAARYVSPCVCRAGLHVCYGWSG